MRKPGFARKMAALLTLAAVTCASAGAETVTVNPKALKRRLLDNNISILTELNQVLKAKDQVNVSRAELLPSINLGGLIGSAGNPSFLLSSVSVLLPFLFPSKWLDLKEAHSLLNAELVSYDLVQLNTLASAYALYSTILEDNALLGALTKQHDDLVTLAFIAQERAAAGISPPDEALQAQARERLSAVKVSQASTLVKKELATLRQALGLSLSDKMSLDVTHVPSSSYEGSSVQKVADKAISLAPENKQVDYMISAAQSNKWSNIFGMLTGVTLSSHWSAGHNGGTHFDQGGVPGSFSPFEGSASLNLGFATFPTISLNNKDIDALVLRKRELNQEQTRIIESVLSELAGAKEQVALAQDAEKQLTDAYEAELNRYKAGSTDLDHLIASQQALTDAGIARISAVADLDQQRISFHRSLMSDQFSQISSCTVPANTKGLPKRPTLDDVCKKVK